MLENYATVFGAAPPKRILELGIFQGGSPALFSLWFDAEKFVGVDICKPVAGFDEFCRKHPIGQRIRSYYDTSQTDEKRIKEIVRAEFGNDPPDLVIDDASHLFEQTRRAFEIAFPLLKSGGTYVIEDWGWAHWPGSEFFRGETPMSILRMEIVMLCASREDLVSEVRVFPSFAFIRKSPSAPKLETLDLSSLYAKRGMEIVATKRLNLRGVAKTMLSRG